MDDSFASRVALTSRERQRVAAFQRLADQYLSESYRLASAILGDPTESRDAVHDAFLTAWRKWDDLREPAKLERWFQRVVVNTCRNRLRYRGRRRRSEGGDAAWVPGSDPFGQIHERLRIEEAISRLKPDDQVVLALRYYRDLKVDDIAGILGVPSGTVMSRLHNAQGRLRALLDEPAGRAGTGR